jgi:putative ABC transport system ATP-binding protein
MSSFVIEASGLHKSYGSTHALVDVDLSVRSGESLAIMGASGSGKTTLLHCLAGITPPDAGSVEFLSGAGRVQITGLGERERSRLRREAFGFVFQEGLLIPELTAVENVALAHMLNGMPRARAEEYGRGWLAALGLAGMEDRRIGQLSGGQAQRVAIARAQVTGAAVVFADEPTGALDSRTGREVLGLLRQVVDELGQTVVMVTHDPVAASYADRVLFLADGRFVGELTAPTAGRVAERMTHLEG